MGYCYIVHNGFGGSYAESFKIGRTKSLQQRLKQLKSAYPRSSLVLSCNVSYLGDYCDVERKLHERYAARRNIAASESFYLTTKDLGDIAVFFLEWGILTIYPLPEIPVPPMEDHDAKIMNKTVIPTPAKQRISLKRVCGDCGHDLNKYPSGHRCRICKKDLCVFCVRFDTEKPFNPNKLYCDDCFKREHPWAHYIQYMHPLLSIPVPRQTRGIASTKTEDPKEDHIFCEE